MFKTLLKSAAVAFVLAASVLVPTQTASAHHGNASGACVNNVGVITASFQAWGDRSNLLGNIVVKVNGQVVDQFKATADNFTRTYKPYTYGEYTVRADWVMDYNHNGTADQNERFSFENKVKIEGCEAPVEKCTVPGKTHLPKNDPNCKEDEKCVVPGKTHLPKNDPSCKEDVKKCEVAGKTDLPANDPKCKEDTKPAVLPATGNGTGLLIALPLFATVAGALLKSRSYAKR